MKTKTQSLPRELRPENTENLKEVYEQVYTCNKCGIMYGSDLKKEKIPFLCPICLEKTKM